MEQKAALWRGSGRPAAVRFADRRRHARHSAQTPALRDVDGCFDAGDRLGVTADALTWASLDPPLASFSLDNGAWLLHACAWASEVAAVAVVAVVAVNVLAARRLEPRRRRAGTATDIRAGVDHETWTAGALNLSHRLTDFDCRPHAVHDRGDHEIRVGEAARAGVDANRARGENGPERRPRA